MTLVDIPFVVAVADWIWGTKPAEDDSEVSSEICLESLPWLTSACLSRLIIKSLGIAIILGSFLNKAPIMINMLNSQSSAGLSLMGFYGEVIIYCDAAFYGYLNGYPISAYGENVALSTQTIILVMLIWKLQEDPTVTLQERVLVTLVFVLYCYGVLVMLPADLYYILMASMLPMLLFSRGSQISKTFKVKHTGAQSILTLTMNLGGGLIRILTTIKEIGWDFNVLNGFFLSVTLNFTMFFQYWIYHANTMKFMEDLEKKKKA